MDYLQSFPPQRIHTPYPHHYYPSWIPPQTNIEATKPPGAFEPWAYGSSYAYPNSTECHSCCNQSYPTGYYAFRPQHSHLPPPPPPSQFYYHGPYSPYVDTFPTHYVHPHYSMEHPRFVIDKSMPESHCCACPNHKCNGMKAKGVKIEEHDPEVREKASEPLGFPQIKNYPNPMVWVPPEFTNGGVGKPSESDPRLWNGCFPYNMKNNKDSSKSFESEPKVCNGWIPLDLNGLKSLKQGGHEDEKQTEEKKEKIPQHPILWVPVFDKSEQAEKRDLKENEVSPKDSEEQPKKYRIIPLKYPYNDNCGVQAGPVEDTSTVIQSKAKEDKVEHKSSPVMQMEDKGEKKTLEDSKKKTKSIPVKEANEQVDKELSSNMNVKRQSPSPPKATKLPPVCLRVDPLPRRKSRSLSPPSSKENVVKKVDSISKPPSSPTMEKVHQESNLQADFVSNKENELKSKKQESDVVEGTYDQSKKEGTKNTNPVQVAVNVPVVSNKETITEKAELREEKSEVGRVNEEAEEKPKEGIKEKEELSPTKAAVQIQSMYRGYEVRRWEPLKKLRQIAKVREQVEEVRNQITSLESSNMQNNEKQRMLIGETIMSLLLQLDTIQGLHPSVRDIRKSVARDLICLQEKLDSLNSQTIVGLKSKEADVVCNVRPAKEEAKYETGHAPEHISVEATDEPKDLILEKDESSDKLKESEQNLLEMSCSKVEEADQQLVDTETKVDAIKQHIESAMYDKEPVSTAEMENEMKHGGLRNNSEVTVESQMENEDLKISSNEPVGSVLVAGEEPDKVAEFNERTCGSEVAADYVVAEAGEVVNLVKEDSDMELHSLTVLPVEVREEEPVTSSFNDQDVTYKFGEVENLIPENYAEPRLEESVLLPVQEKSTGEEAELVEVSKPEEPLLEERSHPEVPTEAEKICDAYSLGDANTFPSESIGIPVPSLKFMKVSNETAENKIDGLAEEYEVPRVEQLIPEQTHNHGNPFPNVDALENMLEQLPAKEEEETQERVVDSSCGSEVVERKVMELAPASEQVTKEETGYTPRDVNVNGSALTESKENDNLIKENEKLREMLHKLIAAGNEQLNVISNLNGRVKDLEKKLTKNKRLKMRRKRIAAGGSQCQTQNH